MRFFRSKPVGRCSRILLWMDWDGWAVAIQTWQTKRDTTSRRRREQGIVSPWDRHILAIKSSAANASFGSSFAELRHSPQKHPPQSPRHSPPEAESTEELKIMNECSKALSERYLDLKSSFRDIYKRDFLLNHSFINSFFSNTEGEGLKVRTLCVGSE